MLDRREDKGKMKHKENDKITEWPKRIQSDFYKESHVQGIAVDREKGYVYYSFTTMLLKTDLQGRVMGSVKGIVGHLGCITFDEDRRCVYGSLELKHDQIGEGIMKRTGIRLSEEDTFYLVRFETDRIDRTEMDAEKDGIMCAVCLHQVGRDYAATDTDGRPHRYGCSGIDGTGYGPDFGAPSDSEKKIFVCYGIYEESDRMGNDCQVIMKYSPAVFETYGQPLHQTAPHREGPQEAEETYFLHTGNTCYGVQNLEYDPWSKSWLLAVYCGKKEHFANYPLFFVDGRKAPIEGELPDRGGEKGKLLHFFPMGETEDGRVYGSRFPYGSTGICSLGDGRLYFSHPHQNKEERSFSCEAVLYRINGDSATVFSEEA
jgi:hypothetical protein